MNIRHLNLKLMKYGCVMGEETSSNWRWMTMLTTIKHQDTGPLVVVAKCLTGYIKINEKVSDAESYVKVNGIFDADYTAFMVSWQTSHGCTPDGIIGPATWTAISKAAPTCSTSKNRKSGYTFALQLLIGGNLTADAIYGPRTKAAVVTIQDAHKLVKDGICGPKTWNVVIAGEELKPEPEPQPTPAPGKFEQPVDYKQGASPWGSKMYSNHNDKSQTMANSGCGPTAMADVVATLKDRIQQPYKELAELSMKWGDRTYNSGTAWTFFQHVADHFDFVKMVQTKSFDALKACLDAGGYVVCSMGPGYWTSGGHFITAWKYDATYVYCNDPASSSRKKQNIADFKSQSKQYFCFYPEANAEDNAGGDAQPKPYNGTKRGNVICDVARFQGKINWDVLAPQLAFVVIKATGLYRNGADTQYMRNVSEAVRLGVPFHVYSYLYCTSESMAKRDAKLYFDTVKAGGHWPLFWVLDLEAGWGAKDKDAPRLAAAFEAELRRLAMEHGPGEIRVAGYVAQEKYSDWAIDYDHFAYLWIPGYGEKWKPKMPCDLWQYTSTGSLPGISGNVDLNVLMGRKPLDFFTKGV